MKGLVWLCLLVAGVATGVVAVMVLREPPPPPQEFPVEPEPPEAEPAPPSQEALRPHETNATLAEDLRDALAGPPADLGAEVRRVSERLQATARSVLLATAPGEASPKVRALLVLAAGRHVPDEGLLLAFLEDPWPVVRQAAALATAHAADGRPVTLLPGVEAPVGRTLPDATRRALEARLAREEDQGVRGTLTATLAATARDDGADGER